MKKILVTTLLALAATSSMAQTSVTLGGAVAEADSNGQETVRTSVTVRTALAKGVAGDVAVINSRNNTTKGTSVRQEVGLTAVGFETSVVTANLRTAVGVKSVSGADRVEYYSLEPGVNFKATQDLTARVAYRFRDSFSSNGNDRSDTMRYGLSYALTKKDTVGFIYDVVKKDGAEKAYNFSYTRSF